MTEIASELRVGQVLTGSVRWATGADGKKQFRVTTELVDGKTGKVTWTDTFDGDVTDPFAVQGQIATRVATALGTVLAKADAQNLAGRPTQNAEAYDLYLKGRSLTGGSASTSRAVAALMERAVVLDSNFVGAWGNLALSLTGLYGSGTRDPVTAKRAKEALDRARPWHPIRPSLT